MNSIETLARDGGVQPQPQPHHHWKDSADKFAQRKRDIADINSKTAVLLRKADEMAARCLSGQYTPEQAMLPIEAVLLDLRDLYRNVLDYRKPKPVVAQRRAMLYVMSAPGGLYKIGISRNIKQRLSTLQGSAGLSLKVVFCRRVGLCARSAEQYIHAQFTAKRVRGEWFALDAEDLNRIGPLVDEFLRNPKRPKRGRRRDSVKCSG